MTNSLFILSRDAFCRFPYKFWLVSHPLDIFRCAVKMCVIFTPYGTLECWKKSVSWTCHSSFSFLSQSDNSSSTEPNEVKREIWLHREASAKSLINQANGILEMHELFYYQPFPPHFAQLTTQNCFRTMIRMFYRNKFNFFPLACENDSTDKLRRNVGKWTNFIVERKKSSTQVLRVEIESKRFHQISRCLFIPSSAHFALHSVLELWFMIFFRAFS